MGKRNSKSAVVALAGAAILLMLAGCSSSDTTGAPAPVGGADAATSASNPDAGKGAATADSGAAAADSGAAPTTDGDAGDTSRYPAGPYGVKVGDTIENRSWMGYSNPAADAVSTTKPYGPYSLDDARRSGKKYAMVNLAESMCPGCQKSAREFKTDAKAIVDAGGVVIELLETTGFTTQASKSDLDAWVNKYALPVTAVKDPDGTGTPSLTALGPREHAYILDLTTMKILQVITGDNTGFGATSGGKGLTAMRALLKI